METEQQLHPVAALSFKAFMSCFETKSKLVGYREKRTTVLIKKLPF
jgi:hypothetical protein